MQVSESALVRGRRTARGPFLQLPPVIVTRLPLKTLKEIKKQQIKKQTINKI